MQIPDGFKAIQKSTFQDKTITHYPAVMTVGELGSVIVQPAAEPAESYLVNAQKVRDELEAKEWGLTINKDLRITVSDPVPILTGDFVKSESVVYRVIRMIELDSHTLIYAKAVD